jgi:hypothetical protein
MNRLINFQLRGDYAGNRDADIHFKFRFCDGGVYYYLVEQGGIWRLAHRGRFDIRAGLRLKPNAPEGRVIRLAPAIVDIDPKEHYVYGLLEERGLPAKQTEDYMLSGYSHDHAVNPRLKIVHYTFCIPGADIYSARDWSIQPIGA